MEAPIQSLPQHEKPPRHSGEADVLVAIRELQFGTVEVVVHQGKITEIRQTKRQRLEA